MTGVSELFWLKGKLIFLFHRGKIAGSEFSGICQQLKKNHNSMLLLQCFSYFLFLRQGLTVHPRLASNLW